MSSLYAYQPQHYNICNDDCLVKKIAVGGGGRFWSWWKHWKWANIRIWMTSMKTTLWRKHIWAHTCLWGLNMQWLLPTKTVPRKHKQWTGDRVMGNQSLMMHTGSEGWPSWSNPTEELLLKILMLVIIQSCQKTWSTACCVWCCVTTN